MMPLFSVDGSLSCFFGFIAHLIIPHILQASSKNTRILRKFVNCIGHFVGNRIMPAGKLRLSRRLTGWRMFGGLLKCLQLKIIPLQL